MVQDLEKMNRLFEGKFYANSNGIHAVIDNIDIYIFCYDDDKGLWACLLRQGSKILSSGCWYDPLGSMERALIRMYKGLP
jgi:hypothetical protein